MEGRKDAKRGNFLWVVRCRDRGGPCGYDHLRFDQRRARREAFHGFPRWILNRVNRCVARRQGRCCGCFPQARLRDVGVRVRHVCRRHPVRHRADGGHPGRHPQELQRRGIVDCGPSHEG